MRTLAKIALVLAAGFLSIVTASAALADAGKFTDLKLYTSRTVNGEVQPYAPEIGDIYQMTLDYNVVGTLKAPYSVRLQMANQHLDALVTELSPGAYQLSARFFMPLDGPIKMQARVPFDASAAAEPVSPNSVSHRRHQATTDTDSAQTGLIQQSFTPIPPDHPIEYYKTRTVDGTQTAVISFLPVGSIDRIVTMHGALKSSSWQKVLKDEMIITTAQNEESLDSRPVENDSRYPVFYWDRRNVPAGRIELEEHFTAQLSDVKVNADKLRTVTWRDMDAARKDATFNLYSQPEDVIESRNPAIRKFVRRALGSNYRSRMTPYDAARRIFQAVIAHTVYYYADDRPDTALKVLRAGKGDCGGFSLLLVACWRHIGIPSRTAAGYWIGKNEGHCWSEMWFPPHGWVVADGSAGNALCEDGSLAYQFGNIPTLNLRVAFMRGNTFNIGDVHTSWLQLPMCPEVSGTTYLEQFRSDTVIRDITSSVDEPAPVSLPDNSETMKY